MVCGNLNLAGTSTVSQTALPHQLSPARGSDGIDAKPTEEVVVGGGVGWWLGKKFLSEKKKTLFQFTGAKR